MRRNFMLKLSIILFIISIIIVFMGIWKNDNSAKFLGFILLAIVNILNFVRGINRWNDGK